MDSFFFWAQSLDNSSPDYIYVDRKALNPKKYSAERRKVVSQISNVTKNVDAIATGKNVKIFIGKEEFALSIILPEVDELNRKAPILCYSKLPDPGDQYFSKRALLFIHEFVEGIGRTLPNSTTDEIFAALSLAKKKRTLSGRTIVVGLLILFILLLLLAVLFIIITTKTG